MRILDKNDIELREENIDLNLGYLIDDKIFVKHHEAIEGQPAKSHYWPLTYYFSDGSQYTLQNLDDAHVKVKNTERTSFDWNSLEGEEERSVFGIDLQVVEDQPEIQAQEAWNEYEQIKRYIEYTQEELDKKAEEQRKKDKQDNFMIEGPDKLDETINNLNLANENIEDIILLLAEVLGAEG